MQQISAYVCTLSICSLLPTTGFISTSTVVLYCAFWCLYIFHLLLKLVFPIWSKVIYNSEHSLKIHIVEVTCVFIAGTLPYIVLASTSKNQIGSFPPTGCAGEGVYSFYTLVFPTVILSCTGLVMMLFILYNVHIVSDTVSIVYTCWFLHWW